MKKLNYNRSLKKDLKTYNKKERKWDIILIRTLNQLAAVAVSIPIIAGIAKLIGLNINWVVTLSTLIIWDTISGIRSMREDIKKRKNQVLDAEIEINNLIREINIENEDAINLVPRITFDGIEKAITTKKEEETKEYIAGITEKDGYTQKTKITTTDFYLLDTEDKIRVLREIRKEITKKGDNKVENDLYLLEDKDIPNYVPTVRTLERK